MRVRKIAHAPSEARFSRRDGGKIRTNPWSLISEEKLETQKGIKNNRNVCQRSGVPLPAETLNTSAVPITALIPSELSQIDGEASK